jgi:hypothetical protein
MAGLDPATQPKPSSWDFDPRINPRGLREIELDVLEAHEAD